MAATTDGGGTGSGEAAPSYLARGTPAFRRANIALFAAGFSTFTLLYCVQPLMPVFAVDFGVSAAASSLALSLSTGIMAPLLLVAGSLSEALGRRSMMAWSLLVSAMLMLAAAMQTSYAGFLVLRTLEGIALSGLPAVAMAYLAEEMDPRSLGLAVGLLIGGNALGGMAGRCFTGVVTDLASWRAALVMIGVLGLVASVIVWRCLPPSRHFKRHALSAASLAGSLLRHLADPGLPWLFLLGGLVQAGFVTIYNDITFVLLAPPYGLSQTVISAIFAIYLIGIVSSAIMGQIADRLGRRRVLWAAVIVMLGGVLLTTAAALALIILGVIVVTIGFFGAHSIASSWVSRRAREARAQASALYLFAFYAGGSIAGPVGGWLWAGHGWPGVAAMVGALVVAALAVSLRLSVLPPVTATPA